MDRPADPAWHQAVAEIVEAGRRLDRHGWVPAGAGNLSRRLGDRRIAITRTGVHKGFLLPDDVIEIGLDGAASRPTGRPSAETLLHCQIYRDLLPEGAVLHGHSVAATVLSLDGGDLTFADYELLKAFEGQSSHLAELRLPVFDNDQDIARLAGTIAPRLAGCAMGYLIRGHGVYVWGPTMDAALARLEALEFLLACTLERRKLGSRR